MDEEALVEGNSSRVARVGEPFTAPPEPGLARYSKPDGLGNADIQVVQVNDPRLQGLTGAGYVVVGESWGARLRLSDPPDLTVLNAAVAAATDHGFRIEELDASWAPQVKALEAVNHADYPYTPATSVPHRDESDVLELWSSGCRLFGATTDGQLVAVSVICLAATRAETEFTSVHRAYRRRGLAVAVKAASITALAADGVRNFGTGGAQINAGSIRMNELLGYAIEERWLSLSMPQNGLKSEASVRRQDLPDDPSAFISGEPPDQTRGVGG